MVKLVVSDIDGTLLFDKSNKLSPRIFQTIRDLQAHGIIFAPASGRSVQSLQNLFEDMAPELPLLCDNGGIVFGPGADADSRPIYGMDPIPREDAMSIAHEIQQFSGVCLSISTPAGNHVIDDELAEEIQVYANAKVIRIQKPEDVEGPILNVSLVGRGREREVYEAMAPKWSDRYSVALSGGDWLVFTHADKGRGLKILCGALRVDLKDVMAFGDNYNDLSMLELAGQGYIMSNAAPALREKVQLSCPDVCDVLEKMMEEG